MLKADVDLEPLWEKYQIQLEIMIEPIGCWENDEGKNRLKDYYLHPLKTAYEFQSLIQLDYFQRVVQLTAPAAVELRRQNKKTCLIIMERSFYSNPYD